MITGRAVAMAALVASALPAAAQAPGTGPASAGIDWVPIGSPAAFLMARTETTVGQFRRWVRAQGIVTEAERAGGGEVYEAGWTRKPGWVWSAPFGQPAHDDEPAVHVTYGEAQAFCRWAGGHLPTDREWELAAYTESRPAPPAPLRRGRTYPYPLGDSPGAAQCLDDCSGARERAVAHGARLWRGFGHARAGQTPAGINGLHDMGGNAWEWVDDGSAGPERRTRGGSWWYGAAPMQASHLQTKPPDTRVVYIGFRCARKP